jgi:aromatic ring-opening dioxygenase catalytic subunit (LigB family)
MGTFVGAFAASHGPIIVRDWDKLPTPLQERFTRNFREVGRRIAAVAPDVLVVISPDHWVNFFLNNLPTVCIGVGEENDGPPEPFMASFPYRALPGDARFAQHMMRSALDHGFDPSASYRLTLDHGFCIPLWLSDLPTMPRIVPVIINALQDPMPTIERCLQLGHMISAAVQSYPADVPTMGDVDENFDRIALDALRGHDERQVALTISDALMRAGNGSHEVRCWVVAHGAAGPSNFDLIDYMPCPEVYVGCAFGSWQPA